jgi:hypothetical protein
MQQNSLENLKALRLEAEIGKILEPIMADAVISPLLILILVQRHIIGRLGHRQIGVYALSGTDFRQNLITNLFADQMRFLDAHLGSHSVITKLADAAFANNVEAFNDLKRRLPIPYVGGKFKVLGAEIMQGEAHKFPFENANRGDVSSQSHIPD